MTGFSWSDQDMPRMAKTKVSKEGFKWFKFSWIRCSHSTNASPFWFFMCVIKSSNFSRPILWFATPWRVSSKSFGGLKWTPEFEERRAGLLLVGLLVGLDSDEAFNMLFNDTSICGLCGMVMAFSNSLMRTKNNWVSTFYLHSVSLLEYQVFLDPRLSSLYYALSSHSAIVIANEEQNNYDWRIWLTLTHSL